MSLTAFEDAARAHFANPPATWTVTKVAPRRWDIVTAEGDVIESCTTQRDAIHRSTSSPFVQLWHNKTQWYLGNSGDPRDRPLTNDEHAIIDEIIGHVTRHTNVFDNASPSDVVAVRFLDRDETDDTVWDATPISPGRWLIRGLPWWTFATEELEFLDHRGADTHRTGLLAEFAAACDKWDRILEDDLAGHDAENDAATRIVAIARRLIPTFT